MSLKITLKLGKASAGPPPAPPVAEPPVQAAAAKPKRPPKKRKKPEESSKPPAAPPLPGEAPPPEKKKRERKKKEKKDPAKQAAEAEAEAAAAAKAPLPLTKKLAENLAERVRKQDQMGIFAEPVTEEIAPGYFNVVTRPMDLSTLRANISSGTYPTWDALWVDLETMFTNAMKYNPPDTVFYQQARVLLQATKKMVDKEKRVAEKKIAEKEAKRRAKLGLGPAPSAASGPGGAADAGGDVDGDAEVNGGPFVGGGMGGVDGGDGDDGGAGGGDAGGADGAEGEEGGRKSSTARPIVTPYDGRRPLSQEEYRRATFQASLGGDLGALGGGATGDGVRFSASRVVMRAKPGLVLPPDGFVSSLCRFAAKLGPRARERAAELARKVLAGQGPQPKLPASQPGQLAQPVGQAQPGPGQFRQGPLGRLGHGQLGQGQLGLGAGRLAGLWGP